MIWGIGTVKRKNNKILLMKYMRIKWADITSPDKVTESQS